MRLLARLQRRLFLGERRRVDMPCAVAEAASPLPEGPLSGTPRAPRSRSSRCAAGAPTYLKFCAESCLATPKFPLLGLSVPRN